MRRQKLVVLILILSVCILSGQNVVKTALSDNVYSFFFYNSFYVTVSAGEDGLLLVDTGYERTVDLVKSALTEFGNKDIKYVINTHYHYDHTGGNMEFGKDAVTIAHDFVGEMLSSDYTLLGRDFQPIQKEARPDITFDDCMSVFFNGEEIRLHHLPGGHSGGDIIVYFTESNVLCAGDLLFTDMIPFVDMDHGGNAVTYFKNVRKIFSMFPENVKIVPGHGKPYTMPDWKNYCDKMEESIETIRKAKEAGKSIEDMKTEKILSKWEHLGTAFNTDFWMEAVYKSLNK